MVRGNRFVQRNPDTLAGQCFCSRAGFQISEFQVLCSVLESRKHWQGQWACNFLGFGQNEIFMVFDPWRPANFREEPKP